MQRLRTRPSRAPAVFVAGIVSILASATPAGASYVRDFQPVTASSPRDSQSSKVVRLQCPGQGLAIGVGGSVPAISNVGLSGALSGGAIFVRANETDSEPAPWALTGRAWCVQPTNVKPAVGGAANYVKQVVISRNQSSSNSNGFKSVQAACPAESPTVIAGGGRVAGATNEVALESIQRLQSGRVLRARAHETDATGASWALEAHAICANTTTALTTNVYAYDFHIITSGTTTSSANKTVTKSCDSGEYVVGGSVNTLTGPSGTDPLPPPPKVVVTESRPVGDGPRATGWTATAVETDPTAAPWSLEVRAACARLNGTYS